MRINTYEGERCDVCSVPFIGGMVVVVQASTALHVHDLCAGPLAVTVLESDTLDARKRLIACEALAIYYAARLASLRQALLPAVGPTTAAVGPAFPERR